MGLTQYAPRRKRRRRRRRKRRRERRRIGIQQDHPVGPRQNHRFLRDKSL